MGSQKLVDCVSAVAQKWTFINVPELLAARRAQPTDCTSHDLSVCVFSGRGRPRIV